MTNPYRHHVKDLIRDGVRPSEIAERAGVTPGAVTRWLKADTGMDSAEWRAANGWVGTVPPEQVAAALDIWSTNPDMTRRELAERVGLSDGQIQAIFDAREPAPRHRRRTVLTEPKTLHNITRAYQDGQTTVTLAAQHDVDEKTIRRRLDDAQIKRRPRGGGPRRTTPEERDRVLSAWEDTPTVKAVAQATGIGRSRVARIIDEEGINRQHRRSPKDRTLDEDLFPLIRAAWNDKPTISHVATVTNIHWNRARRLLTEAGLLADD